MFKSIDCVCSFPIFRKKKKKKKEVLYYSTKKNVLIPKDPIKIIGPFVSVGFHTYKRNANPWENVLSSFNNICFL